MVALFTISVRLYLLSRRLYLFSLLWCLLTLVVVFFVYFQISLFTSLSCSVYMYNLSSYLFSNGNSLICGQPTFYSIYM
jgi:hypothetical protein